jgi:hypothetical protein
MASAISTRFSGFEATVEVSYKPEYRSSTLIELFGARFAVDQAAYWALQEVGWLFP